MERRPAEGAGLQSQAKAITSAYAVGDIIEVELRISSVANYQYVAFEDPKPAGCEPTQVRSGGKGQEGFYSYMELRDEKVVFFTPSLQQGEHLLRDGLHAPCGEFPLT